MSSNLPETLEVYREAWLIFTKTEIAVEETDVQETGLGLIGPGNRFPTWSFHHDVFGKIYLKAKEGPGCTYGFRNCKGWPVFGY